MDSLDKILIDFFNKSDTSKILKYVLIPIYLTDLRWRYLIEYFLSQLSIPVNMTRFMEIMIGNKF